jgi:hypothetical protein
VREDRASLITATAAVFVGAAALVVSIYGVIVQRQQLRAQAWPHLEVSFSNSNVDGFSVHLQNVGVGPAEIRSVAVWIDGKPVKTWREALERVGAKTERLTTSYLTKGRVVATGADLAVLGVPNGVPDYEKTTDRISIDLCYCSVLDECWNLHDGVSASLAACPQPAVAFDNQ